MGELADVVLIDRALAHGERAYTYLAPEPVEVGAVVRVPVRGRSHTGIVIDLPDDSAVVRPQPIRARLGPGLPPELVELARWLADRYLSTLGEALACVLPKRVAGEEDEPFVVRNDPVRGPDLSWVASLEGGAALAGAARGTPGTLVLRPPVDRARAETIADLVGAALSRGRGAIVLVPEVRLAPDLTRALRERFADAVALLGSDRTHRARYRDWLALRAGAARVAVGGRGAIFAPVGDLGLVVVDDEGHAAYKEGRAPRYHARAVAAERARRADAPLVLVGVPPSLEARAAVARGHALAAGPPRSAERAVRPPVTVVEPRERLVPAAASLRAAAAVLAAGGRVVIVLHRAGAVADAAAERATRILTPRRAARLDASTPRRDFRAAVASADLLVTTPVIAKDLSLDRVGLVVLAEADAALAQPAFRAAEEVFATWWRLAPWARDGSVIVETRDPSAPAIVALTRWDPEVLARAEEGRRGELRYPPFVAMARIDVPAARAAEVVEALTAAHPHVEVLGPIEAGTDAVVVARADRRRDLLEALAPLVARWRADDEPMRVDVDPWEVLVPKWRS